MVHVFLHLFGLHSPQGKGNDSQLRENATSNSGQRNAFWHQILTLFANCVQKSSQTSGFIRFPERDFALPKRVICIMLFHHF